MKNLLVAACAIFTPFLFQAQSTKVTRSLPSFHHIGISGGFDVVQIKEGDSESAMLEVSGIDADNIVTEVKDNTLYLKTKNGSWNNFKAKITITYKNLKGIVNTGSSDIEALSVIKSDEFEIASSGSGDFKGTFDVRDLDVAIAGSSDMTLSGKAEEQEIHISGSGDVDAQKLAGTSAEVAISGSGDVKLGVKGKVKTSVSGSGTVTNNK